MQYPESMNVSQRPHQGTSRTVARQAVKAHVSATARSLVLDNGYESTTVEAICASAEISRSTFFRHFTSKDDAVLTDIDETSGLLLEALRARPDEEPVWTALRHALEPLLARYDVDSGPARQVAALISTTPALAAHQHEKHVRWCAELHPEVSRRIGTDPGDTTDPRSKATISAALACLDAAVSAWASAEQAAPISSILKQAMDATRL